MKKNKRLFALVFAVVICAVWVFRSTRKVTYHLEEDSTKNYLHYTITTPSFSNYDEFIIQAFAKTDDSERIAFRYKDDADMIGKELPAVDWVEAGRQYQFVSFNKMDLYITLENQELTVRVVGDGEEEFNQTWLITDETGKEGYLRHYAEDRKVEKGRETLLFTLSDQEEDASASDTNQLKDEDIFYVGIIFD